MKAHPMQPCFGVASVSCCLLTLALTSTALPAEQKTLEEPAKKALRANPQGPIPPRELFERLDANNDLTLTRDEIPEEAVGAFETFLRYGDANDDGKLQGNEFRDLLDKNGPSLAGFALFQRFAQVDKDGDGKIAKTEFQGILRCSIALTPTKTATSAEKKFNNTGRQVRPSLPSPKSRLRRLQRPLPRKRTPMQNPKPPKLPVLLLSKRRRSCRRIS